MLILIPFGDNRPCNQMKGKEYMSVCVYTYTHHLSIYIYLSIYLSFYHLSETNCLPKKKKKKSTRINGKATRTSKSPGK